MIVFPQRSHSVRYSFSKLHKNHINGSVLLAIREDNNI